MAPLSAPKAPSSRTWMVVLIVAFAAAYLASSAGRLLGPTRISYSELREAVDAGRVVDVTLTPTLAQGKLRRDPGGEVYFEAVRVDDKDLVADLRAHGVKITGAADPSSTRETLFWLAAMLALPLALVFFARQSFAGKGGAGGLLAVGHSKAKVYVEDEVKVSFADVAGVDEARDELVEVVEFLRTPERFRRLGGHIPKGVLLVGPPGTGKTLLARAVAGEAKVPFFSISGSEFVEMFVGVGAARVRDLFEQAKERAPCIVFIDEIDALGKARGAGPMAHEEREQTLQQLLVELDGFDARTGVILMAATNRPETLDPALLRAGRFDRHVLVDRPDRAGRIAILGVHARTITMAPDVDLGRVATMTAGLVGADLANILNEAALLAARREHPAVAPADVDEAVERVVAGLAKKSRVLSARERERVAFHEAGHALVAQAIPGGDAVQKVSIIPRGIAALGYTMQLPAEDRFLRTETELKDKIAVLLGGWVSERLVFGEVSTGAADDLAKATDVAHAMVTAYGMAPGLGPLSIERTGRSPWLDSAGTEHALYGERAAEAVESEVRHLLDAATGRVRTLLRARMPALREAARRLLERETITGEEIAEITAAFAPEAATEAAREASSARPPDELAH